MRKCAACGSALAKRPDEKPYLFAKRRYCGNSCSKKTHGGLEEQFWSQVEKSDGCWLWKGATDKGGYGLIKIGGRTGRRVLCHRVSYFLSRGTLPENVLHKCDNPPCVRPDHLFEGTIADNVADMISKGRSHWQKRRAAIAQKG